MKQNKVEEYVKEILERNKSTRENDHLLYIVVYAKSPELVNSNFKQVFKNHKTYGLPSFESVSRCRRKLQEKYSELKPVIEVQKAREEKELEMFEYAMGDKWNGRLDKFIQKNTR